MQIKQSFFTALEHPLTIDSYDEVDCNFCGSDQYRSIGKELFFDIRECLGCGLVYVSPQPSAQELDKFYEAMYPDGEETTTQARSLGYIEPHLRRIVLERKPDVNRLLDAGCGYGLFLKHMEDLPLELTGIEVSETAVAYCRGNVPKATIHQGAVADIELPPESQDCITMIAALEHAKDPRAILERLRGWLAPGGLLVVQVPYSAPFLRIKRWIPFLPITMAAPAHLFDFPPRILRSYFQEAGFRDIRLEVARPYAGKRFLDPLLIWGVKLPGLLLHSLTGGRYIYPFSAAFVCHAVRE